MSEIPPFGGSDRTLGAVQRRRRQARLRLVAVLVLLVIALGFAAWRFWPASEDDRIARADGEPEAPSSAPAPVREPRSPALPPVSSTGAPAASQSAAEPLPPLDESDELVRRLVTELSSRPELAAWLAHDELVERFVLAVDNVSLGSAPRKPVPFLAPSGRYRGRSDSAGVGRPDPRNAARYDDLVNVIDAVDPEGTAELLRRLEPLLDEAYAELGYPGGRFFDALERAIFELLSTPQILGEPAITYQVDRWFYRDDDLESLSSAQKQLLRMGPANVRRVQDKLRAVALALGVPGEELPKAPVFRATG